MRQCKTRQGSSVVAAPSFSLSESKVKVLLYQPKIVTSSTFPASTIAKTFSMTIQNFQNINLPQVESSKEIKH